ncbi:phosphatidylinositol-specific phospholipase C1-like protein [Qipengyuania sp. 6D47A]|uniref:Phosphatidylinositol-specific phospholipase C1-like protein n=1 Tax=Qipengyuania qiaonensis TaxID=2867240 RepID=A0ABS7JA31_9SPHN|nr:phosphatidylinositol-specific phospholipase C1-like protein [Qipengyuania qiaonensis]
MQCLSEIREWSRSNPAHVPIIIKLETKEGRKPAVMDAYEPTEGAPFGDAAFARLHEEIYSVFGRDDLLLPSDLQGDYPSLNAAVRARGWPSLAASRGKVIFLLLDAEEKQREYLQFVEESEADMVLFPSLGPEEPHTAWLQRADPDAPDIAALVKQGFLIYTRADKHTTQARENDGRQRNRAIASGAQLIATDFPTPDRRYSDYSVAIGDGYVGCNGRYQAESCLSIDGVSK